MSNRLEEALCAEPMRGLQKCLLFIPLVFAQGGHLPDQNVLEDTSFDHFYNLEYDQALAGFVADARKSPESADVQNHIAQTILFRAMYRGGMLLSQTLTSNSSLLKMPKLEMSAADGEQFTNAIGRAMELAQSRLKANPHDAAALDALRDMASARKFHNQVTRIDPSMVDAQLTQGVYDYVVVSLSFGWRMLGFVGGVQGNKERGLAMLNRVSSDGSTNRIDATIFLAAIYRREHRSADAICVLKPLISLLPRNYLLRLELAEMYGDLDDHGNALDVLNQVEQLRRAHAHGYETLNADLLRQVRERILINIERNVTSAGG